MIVKNRRSFEYRWHQTLPSVPDGVKGLLLQFSVSRNTMALRHLTTDPQILHVKRLTKGLGVRVTWKPEHRPPSKLTVKVPYAGARPHLANWSWIWDDELPDWKRQQVNEQWDANPLLRPITDEAARDQLDKAPSAANQILARLAYADSLTADDPNRDAVRFFTELDAQTLPQLAGSSEFPEVNATRVALVDREASRIKKKLVQLAANQPTPTGLVRADMPAWDDGPEDFAAVLDIMLPLIERHFVKDGAFDPAGMRNAFLKFALGDLANTPREPHIGSPDSANFLCFPGFAMRAMAMPDPSPIWGLAFPDMVQTAGVYLSHAKHRGTPDRWDHYYSPGKERRNLPTLFQTLNLQLGPHEDMKKKLGALIAAYMSSQVRGDHPV